jgi:CRP-like cAMP-binding protein
VLIAVIGFGLRNVISDTFSGIALSFDHPYRIGDWVEPANGVFGKVTEITWRTTRLITRDGTVVIVPNGVIANGRLVNYSAPNPSYRISLRFWLDARLPVERTKRLLYMGALRAMRGYPDLRPDVLVQETGDSGVLYLVRFWVIDGADENTCRDTVLSAVMRMLQREGIILQAPRRDMAFIQREEEAVPTLEPATHDSVLDHCDLFKLFGEEERMQMARTLVEHRFEKGDVVFNRGAPGGTLFIVADGALEVLSPETGLSKKAVLDRMVPGDVFGEMSLLTGQPRSATVSAATDAVMFEIAREDLDPILRRRPELAEGLAGIMTSRQERNAGRGQETGGPEAPDLPGREDLLGRLRAFFRLG